MKKEQMPTPSKSIIIADGSWKGHHAGYFKTFIRVFKDLGYEVTALCPKPDDVPHTTRCIYFNQPRPSPTKYFHSEIVKATRYSHQLGSLLRTEPSIPANVPLFLPMLDYFTHRWMPRGFLPALWGRPFCGLLISSRDLRLPNYSKAPSFSPLKDAAALGTLDEGKAKEVERVIQRPTIVFPDFSASNVILSSSQHTTRNNDKTLRRPIVSLLGALSRRKGLLSVIRFSKTDTGRKYQFVIAGELQENSFLAHELIEVKNFFDSMQENTIFYNHISTSLFNEIVRTSDVIWAAYEHFTDSSNLLTKASYFKRPVIVRRGALLEERVHQYRLGAMLPPDENDDTPKLIDDALQFAIRQQEQANFTGYSAQHDIALLPGALQKLLTQAGL